MTLRAALTETRDAYRGDAPLDHLEQVRRANVEHHVALLHAAADRGAKLIGFGELFTGPYFALSHEPRWRDLAEELDGPTTRELQDHARRRGIVVVAPIYERDGDRRFNTAAVLDADGRLLGSYRKLHIPEGTNEQGSFCETFYYERGDGGMRHPAPERVAGINRHLPVFDTAVGRIGVAICYDRHFEGVLSGLARGGAGVVLSPAVTFGEKSRRMWEAEFAVEAMRHRLFIGGSNRRGVEPPFGQEYFGASHFVGPDGLVENKSDDDRLVIADLDVDALDQRDDSSGWSIQRDRAPGDHVARPVTSW